MKIQKYKRFLQQQGEPEMILSMIKKNNLTNILRMFASGLFSRIGHKVSQKEDRTRRRKIEEEKERLRYRRWLNLGLYTFSTSSSNDGQNELFPDKPMTSFQTSVKRRKDIITPKLFAASGRCQLGIRDCVYVLDVAIDALVLSADEFLVNKSSIQRTRVQMRNESL